MKKLLFVLLILSSSCVKKEYRYEIHGKVYVPTYGPNPIHNAIWYTDSISYKGDTIYYFNSDGSKVQINPPYFLIDHLK